MEYKGYSIVVEGGLAMYVIRGIGKGALPKVLQGLFTTTSAAKKLIDVYTNSKEPAKG